MSRLGDLIHMERNRQGLTFKQVARKCGVSEKYLQEIESGKRIIADDQARRILKTIGVKEHTEADFSLDDIASTVDLQSALPRIQQLKKVSAEPAEKPESPSQNDNDNTVNGSIWLDALGSVLKRVPVYNMAMKVINHRLLPVIDGKIEDAAPDKVYYLLAPDQSMQGFRIQQGDLVLVVPAHSPVDGAIMIIKTPFGHEMRKVKILPHFQIALQKYGTEFESEIKAIADVTIVGRCVRLEAELG